MALLKIPNEIIFEIAEHLSNQRDILILALVVRRFYGLLYTYRLQYNILQGGSSALIWAAQNDRQTLARELVDLGADVNTKRISAYCGTPLFAAAAKGNFTVVKLLLDLGANPDTAGSRGLKPLYAALSYKHEQVAGLLFNRVRNINAFVTAAKLGLTALHVACLVKLPDSARYLLGICLSMAQTLIAERYVETYLCILLFNQRQWS